jgi:hypothetical protein
VKTLNLFLFQLGIALFFIVLGVMGILPEVDEGVFSLNNGNQTVEAIVGVCEVLAGIAILVGLFGSPKRKTLRLAGYAVFIFWAARIAYTKFITGFFVKGSVIEMNFFMNWLLLILAELIILMSIYLVVKKYSE